jgi:tricorn protease-like protein
MDSNERGSYRTTRKAAMRAYDKLPPSVRRALGDAVYAWAPQPFLTLLRRGGWSPKEIVKDIADLDREELEIEQRERRKKERQR